MFLDSGFGHLAVIVFGMSSGLLLHSIEVRSDHSTILFPLGNKWALFLLFTFIFFLISLPVFSKLSGLENWNIFANFYRSGALVFGGGHVVLPLLQADFVPTGFLSEEQFLVGYGVAQAIPGPMFTFASYLGTLLAFESGSLWYAPTLGVVCLLWIYLPTFLLVPPALWFWSALRGRKKIRAGLSGINAAVVGLLIHSFLFTVIPASLVSALDIVLVCVGFLMLVAFKLPAWIVVLALGSLGWGLAAII
jgi:chromate transporter